VVKVIKKLVKYLLILLVILLTIPTIFWLVIQHSSVQSWFVNKATHIIESKVGSTVYIEKVDFRFFNKILLRNVYIEDLNQDTLVTAETISVSLLGYNSEKSTLVLNRVTLQKAYINFAIDTSGNINFTSFIDKLSSPPDTASMNDGEFGLKFRNIRILESSFRMHEQNITAVTYGINMADLHLSNLNLDIQDLSIVGDTISFQLTKLSAVEKSGFKVDKFKSDISFSSSHMNFERLRLLAMGSNLEVPFLRLSYNGWSDLSNFLKAVTLNGNIKSTTLTTQFLSFFVPELKQYKESFTIAGSFRGSISDLRIRDLVVSVSSATNISLNCNLSGLPDINNTMLFVDIKNFATTIKDVESFKNAETRKALIEVPSNLYALEKVGFSGNFTGFISDFVAYGTLSTAIGSVSIDLSFKPGAKSRTNFNGKVSTRELDLGRLLDEEMLGKLSLKASVTGNTDYDKHLVANTDAFIQNIEVNGYGYSNLQITGNLSNKNFLGSLFLDDPYAKLNFMGKVDFSDSIPVFDFSAFVPKLDLVKINLNETDSISQASFLLTAKFTGNSLDNTKGEVKVVNGFYKNQNGEIKTSDIIISANNTEDSKQISIKSEFIEGELRGKYNYANIFGSIQKMLYLYIPALSSDNLIPERISSGVENPEYNDYIIRLRLKKTHKLSNVLFPTFRIAENTNVFGIYNPDLQTLNLKIKIPEVEFSGNIFKDITLEGLTNDSTFVASITTPLIDIGGTNIKNIAINSIAANNILRTSIRWDNRTSVKNIGEIVANTTFIHQPENTKMDVKIIPSKFILNDTTWNIAQSEIHIDTSQIAINDFVLHNKLQKLKINGIIASLPSDFIRLDLENIDISNFNVYTSALGFDITGNIDGYAMATDISNNPLFYADLGINSLTANKHIIGDVKFNSQWHSEDQRLSVNASNSSIGGQGFNIAGDFFPENELLNFKVSILDFPIALAEPFLDGNVVGLQGMVQANLNITGNASKPQVNGSIKLKEASGLVDFSKTRYRMNDAVLVENSNFVFKNFKVFDVNNRTATLNGSVNTNYFADISLDLNLAPSNFQFLNTTERDNELFYGMVFATGQARLTGTPNDIAIKASVKTEPKTAIFLPLSSSSDVAEHNFVNFINKSDEIIIIEDYLGIETTQKSNIKLSLDLQVTPEAEVQIVIDKQLGDIIRANGAGNLKMEIDLNSDIFNMFGEYVIEKGDYLFTLQGVINKRFQIGQGSTIVWNGDVEDALMDIKAIYSLRTTLGPLNPGSEEEVYKRRTQVDCKINLTGKLMEPVVGFDITVPIAESDPNIKAVVQDKLNTDERINMQFLSLLVINSFTSDVDNQLAGGFSQGLASTASEMLSNQLSNWLSQWSNAFDIGINYRPGDEISSNEIELALSTQLFNDRVTINSNVDMGNQNVNSVIAGDFSIDVKIVPSGKLRVKAFARSNDDVLYGSTNKNDYTTGAGLMYREDFNNLSELWARYMKIFVRPKEPEIVIENTGSESENKSTTNSNQDNQSNINAFVNIK
jgi:hypothetical protein